MDKTRHVPLQFSDDGTVTKVGHTALVVTVEQVLAEAERAISQLTQFARTEHGRGQLAAWHHVRSFITGNWKHY